MSAQHTPGPWRVLPRKNVWWQIQGGRDTDDSEYIAEVENDPDAPDESEANARLIAAAPELLAALRLLVRDEQHENGCHCYNCRGRAAIAKAVQP